MAVRLLRGYFDKFINQDEFKAISPQVELAHHLLAEGKGEGSDFVGWFNLPRDFDRQEFARIKAAAAKIRDESDILVVVGIGGSYLGARAVIELLGSALYNENAELKIYFAGNSISGDYLSRLLKLCEGKRFSVNVVSKSGTTTEPAVAFRAFKQLLEKQYGKQGAAGRIYATTDRSRGTLKQLSEREGYESFVIPDDVGGRYSVLTAVGLLPIAAAGFDIDQLMAGAEAARQRFSNPDLMQNDALAYAAARNLMLRRGKSIELTACYDPAFATMNEWYKQLFGESEGKDGKGLFPASVIFSTDLHSMGQFVQDGARCMFETVVSFGKPVGDLEVAAEPEDFDGLNYLAGKSMAEINDCAMKGTILAHNDGGVPVLLIEADGICEREVGELIYFYELSCGISGYLLGVNPFNQPGVESYKRNMFALLGKPGYEELRGELLKKL